MFDKKIKEKNQEVKENIQETKNLNQDKPKNHKKTYKVMVIMWILAIILGIGYYRVNEKSKTVETVFTRNDEAPKDLKDKIYIYYPHNNSLENMELVVPKVKTKDELLTVSINEVVKKLESDNIIPKVDLKDINYYMTDKKIYLDLPEKIFANVKDAKGELLVLYSFVNTLTNIGGIEQVRFLINNADLEKVKYANLLRDYSYKKSI